MSTIAWLPDWHEEWVTRRDGLTHVRRFREISFNRFHDRKRLDAELRYVAEHPGFLSFGPQDVAPERRGQWIVDRVVEAIDHLAAPCFREPVELPVDQALVLWHLYLSGGYPTSALTRKHGRHFADPIGGRSPRQVEARIKSLMWMGGNQPLQKSMPAIEAINGAITTALTSSDAPPKEGRVASLVFAGVVAATIHGLFALSDHLSDRMRLWRWRRLRPSDRLRLRVQGFIDRPWTG